MTRTPSDACLFVGIMAAATAAGAWLHNDSTWFLGALIVAVIATVAWAITHRHETQPIPYVLTNYREHILRLHTAQPGPHGTENRPTMTPLQADIYWRSDQPQAIWPSDAGAPD